MTTTLDTIKDYLKAVAAMRHGMGPLPKGYTYAGIEDFVLDRGVAFESQRLTIPEFNLVKGIAAGSTFQQKECFYNAQRLVAMLNRGDQLRYFEGFACCGLIPMHHGWAAINGKVIDFTWRLRDNPEYHLSVARAKNPLKDRIWGRFPDSWAYIGVEFPREMLVERLFHSGVAGTIIDDWANEWPLFKQERLTPPPLDLRGMLEVSP